MDVFSPSILTLFVLLGAFAGFLAGLLGIGGGVILVPLFIWAFTLAGFQPDLIVHAAFGTSLLIIIPTALSSTLGHRKRGNVQWGHVSKLAAGGVLGAAVGATLAAVLPGVLLKGLFGAMQILVACKLFFYHPHLPPERSGVVPAASLLLVGFCGGAFSAFFGVGGGVIAVPLMVIMLQLPIHQAVGNSSALIVVSSLAGTLSYVFHGLGVSELPPFSFGYVNLLVGAIVAPFTIILARVGVKVAGGFSHDKLVRIFALLLVVVGLRIAVMTLIALAR